MIYLKKVSITFACMSLEVDDCDVGNIQTSKQGVPEQLGIEPEMGLQDPEVVQTRLSLQEKEFQALMDLPEQEDLHPTVSSRGQAPPLDEVATVAATPESSPEIAPPEFPVPIPAKPAKPPAFEAPDIEVEGGLGDETGHEQHTTLAQDKIQIVTKDVSTLNPKPST